MAGEASVVKPLSFRGSLFVKAGWDGGLACAWDAKRRVTQITVARRLKLSVARP